MKLSLQLTFKFLIKAPLQSLLIIFTMLAGIASLLFMTTIYSSLSKTIDDTISNSLYHVLVAKPQTASIKELHYNEEHLNWINSNEEVKTAFYGKTYNQSFIYQGKEIFLDLTIGESEEIYNYYEITKIVEGKMPKENEIIIPEAVRKQYNIKLPATVTYKLSAYFSKEITISGSYLLQDQFLKYVNALGTYQSVTNKELSSFTFRGLYIKLNDTDNLSSYLTKHHEYFKDSQLHTNSLLDTNTTYKFIKKTQNLVLITIQLFIALAIFMISSSVISYSIKEKRQQIGVLKALGYQQKYLTRTFIIQSYLLGVIASILGYMLTKGGLRFLRYIIRDPQGRPRLIITINEKLYIISFFTVFLTIMLATLNSLRKANISSTTELLKE
ncbi:MAG: FtsX-like permease family protein [Acholeplasmatales bacterium]|jgi:lipoprotein-releasing system permease protein|nr:FtsX-like permease family protein [Acholeplasmatales bacterium]